MHVTASRLAKNAYEVLSKLPQHGIGSKITRVKWMDNSFWTVTGIKLTLNGKSGKSYGILTWRGTQQNEKPTRINGSLKKVWRQLSLPAAGSVSSQPQWTSLASSALNAEKGEEQKEPEQQTVHEDTQGDSQKEKTEEEQSKE